MNAKGLLKGFLLWFVFTVLINLFGELMILAIDEPGLRFFVHTLYTAFPTFGFIMFFFVVLILDGWKGE